ncbi:class I SAM-dependent methyltransferase [Roseibaca sp. Y0-43]|uniref:class I SAM-dependent methyltransferase n=1 Tax=Roseibaca sp. Y0-43 TaxID=2816854 RepID=UPI001D0C2029|nr:class I SAM-dependent methyltransferase [Roseibaca sp. Y0-43]MCC1482858.1 class I SAM-dependent methyltransferase [Roseibaca sp. Y0-43]
MTDWTDGYRTDIAYTYQYFPDLNPARISLALAAAGLVPPKIKTACEIGFGHGVSVNVHAAASDVKWWGTDFNPVQAAFAQNISKSCALNSTLYDEAFADFALRDDLPEFDYICLHGIWSWISEKNRAIIVDFIRRKLAVGGVLYVSYNTNPGWAGFRPMRDLLAKYLTEQSSTKSPIADRIEGALDFADRFLATNPTYLRNNPQVKQRIAQMRSQNRTYLAHEFFNEHWEPMSFADISSWLQPAKIQWACSADMTEAFDPLHLTKDQQELLRSIPDLTFQQNLRDFMVNKSFRKDLWIKGIQKINPVERVEILREKKIILTRQKKDIKYEVSTNLGKLTLKDAIYTPIIDALADYKPKTIGDLEKLFSKDKVNFGQITQAVMVLVGTGNAAPVQDNWSEEALKKGCTDLNNHICSKARGSSDLVNLASPVTGGGVFVSRIEQIFLLAKHQDHEEPRDWAKFALKLLSEQGVTMRSGDRLLQNDGERIAHLTEMANAFLKQRIPLLRALGIA